MDSLISSLSKLSVVDQKLSQTISTKIQHIAKTSKVKINKDDIGFLVNQMNQLTDKMQNLNMDEKVVDDITVKFRNAMLALIQKSQCCDVYGDFPIPPPYQEAF